MQAAQQNAPPGCPVTFAVGTADQLPVPTGSADLVWCCDVLSLVEDLGSVYREFRRVLKPGGRALIYQMFTTSLLEPGRNGLPAAGHGLLGLGDAPRRVPRPPSPALGCGSTAARCWAANGASTTRSTLPERGRHLLHAARLLRDPERYIARFGKQNYDIKLGDCLWHIYRMIGKLSGRVYLLSAPG